MNKLQVSDESLTNPKEESTAKTKARRNRSMDYCHRIAFGNTRLSFFNKYHNCKKLDFITEFTGISHFKVESILENITNILVFFSHGGEIQVQQQHGGMSAHTDVKRY